MAFIRIGFFTPGWAAVDKNVLAVKFPKLIYFFTNGTGYAGGFQFFLRCVSFNE
jgi:hypothetical protein